MNRTEFLKLCTMLGIGVPMQSMLGSCRKEDAPVLDSTDSVIIVGAGAAGLTAAYLLNQAGVDFQLLEASSQYGGRMRRTLDFVDFPIPLGAEWLHVERGVFDEIVNNPAVSVSVETTPYNFDEDIAWFDRTVVSMEDIGFTIDQKFINASWFDFFEQYIIPSIEDKIEYKQVVKEINYSGKEVMVSTSAESYTARAVICTIPLKILQNNAITFNPTLPKNKINAINNVTVWDGCKAFIQFTKSFYPTAVYFDIKPLSAGQRMYYDAAYGQNTNQHVLGLFAVGTGTLPYTELSDVALIEYMLQELDELFDGQASPNYIKHIFQNWND